MQCHLPYSRDHFLILTKWHWYTEQTWLPEEEVITAIRQMALHVILVRTTEGDTSVLNIKSPLPVPKSNLLFLLSWWASPKPCCGLKKTQYFYWSSLPALCQVICIFLKYRHTKMNISPWISKISTKFLSISVQEWIAYSFSFLSPPLHIARWAHMHHFLSVCHTFKNSYLRNYYR